MELFYKQLIIIIMIFIIYLWVQYMDDKKHNIKRLSLYEKYKNPILVSAIGGLLLNLDIENCFNYFNQCNKSSKIDIYSLSVDTIYPPPF